MGRIFVDFEFNSYKGEVMSVGLVNSMGVALYNIFPKPQAPINDWVDQNVVPQMESGTPNGIRPLRLDAERFQEVLQAYLQKEEGEIEIVADWPDDVKYFSELLITGPGRMISIPGIVFRVVRVDAYTDVRPLEGAVQHHALWDALQLRRCITGFSNYEAFRTT